MISRTEALQSLNAGRFQSYQQAIERGDILAENVTKQWKSLSDTRVRETHAAMHNQTVGYDAVFTSPSGAVMMHPGDTSMGAGAGEIIQCRCHVNYRVRWGREEMRNVPQ